MSAAPSFPMKQKIIYLYRLGIIRSTQQSDRVSVRWQGNNFFSFVISKKRFKNTFISILFSKLNLYENVVIQYFLLSKPIVYLTTNSLTVI